MTITYRVGNGLYINMTNRCTNDCEFCVRQYSDSYGDSVSLWLDNEPTREKVFEEISKHDLTEYEEIVFCGFGEPTVRLDDLLWLSKQIKNNCTLPIRVNTNGHANLIAGYDTTPMFSESIDRISISLNASSANEYNQLCKPVYGNDAYQGVLEFAKRVRAYVPETVLSIVSGTTDVEQCRLIAEKMNLPLRVR